MRRTQNETCQQKLVWYQILNAAGDFLIKYFQILSNRWKNTIILMYSPFTNTLLQCWRFNSFESKMPSHVYYAGQLKRLRKRSIWMNCSCMPVIDITLKRPASLSAERMWMTRHWPRQRNHFRNRCIVFLFIFNREATMCAANVLFV